MSHCTAIDLYPRSIEGTIGDMVQTLLQSVRASKAASVSQPRPRIGGAAQWRLRATLLAGCVLSVALAVWVSDPVGSLYGDPRLATLLRGMAIIKGFAVLAAVAALLWRFGQRVTAPVAISYCLSAWAMTATAMLIWQLTRITFDAVVFHIALTSLLVTAWRDDNIDLLDRFSRRFGRHR